MSCHIVRHMSENRLYAQPKFQFDRKSRFIYRTYTHETKTRYMSRLSRYMSAWHDMCPTIPIYKPSFCLKMTNWYAILMTYTTYICHVGYMSCMSFIYRVFFKKLSNCHDKYRDGWICIVTNGHISGFFLRQCQIVTTYIGMVVYIS
jgi:hypothetical protein